MIMKTWWVGGALLCAVACGRRPAGPPALPAPPQHVPAPPRHVPAPRKPAATCGQFGPSTPLGKISKRVREASGAVQSWRDPTVLWVHNDGPDGRLFGLSLPKGKVVAEVSLARARPAALDWEELSAGPCGTQLGGGRCLVIGDIGDNDGVRQAIVFHRLKEPAPRGGVQRISRFETMRVRYPQKRFNSEAFVMDDAGVIWLWTKGDKHTRLYRVPFVAGSTTLELVAKVKSAHAMGVSPGRGARLTAAAWDGGSQRLLLRSYDAVWELCLGAAGLGAMPTAAWHRVTVAHEKQGEAIAWTRGGFFHVSEGKHARLYRVGRR